MASPDTENSKSHESATPTAAYWQESCLPIPAAEWQRINKFDPRGAALADEHYSRRKVGSPQWMPPGETLNLLSGDGRAAASHTTAMASARGLRGMRRRSHDQ